MNDLESIQHWFYLHRSEIGASEKPPFFNGPASSREIEDLEVRLQRKLPEHLRTLLGKCNGVKSDFYSLPARGEGSWRLMSTAEIDARWIELTNIQSEIQFRHPVRTQGPVQAQWWIDGWIPIAENGSGDVLCVDTTPSDGGSVGQIILYMHDLSMRKVLYASLVAWLQEAAKDLADGKYYWEPGVGLQLERN